MKCVFIKPNSVARSIGILYLKKVIVHDRVNKNILGHLAKVEYELSAQVKSDQTYSAKEIFQVGTKVQAILSYFAVNIHRYLFN